MSDDRPEPDPLPIDPSLLTLPPGYESSGDPVEGNPFPPGTTHHAVWHEATQRAEAESARLKAQWLAAQEERTGRRPARFRK